MSIFQIGEPYNLFRSTNTAAVEKHIMVAVFGKGQYGEVTIGLPNLLFNSSFAFFLAYLVQFFTSHVTYSLYLLSPSESRQDTSRCIGISLYP